MHFRYNNSSEYIGLLSPAQQRHLVPIYPLWLEGVARSRNQHWIYSGRSCSTHPHWHRSVKYPNTDPRYYRYSVTSRLIVSYKVLFVPQVAYTERVGYPSGSPTSCYIHACLSRSASDPLFLLFRHLWFRVATATDAKHFWDIPFPFLVSLVYDDIEDSDVLQGSLASFHKLSPSIIILFARSLAAAVSTQHSATFSSVTFPAGKAPRM